MANNKDRNIYMNDDLETVGDGLDDGQANQAKSVNPPIPRVSTIPTGSPNNDMARGVGKRIGDDLHSNSKKNGISAADNNEIVKKDNNAPQNSVGNPATGTVKTSNKNDFDKKSNDIGSERKNVSISNSSNGTESNVITKIGNRLSNSRLAITAKSGLSKIGLSEKEGLEKKETNNEENSDGDSHNQTQNSENMGLKLVKFKISASVLSIAFILSLLFLLFIIIFTALLAVFEDDENSMCGEYGSYSGSGDVLEFMCGMQSPVKDYVVTSKFGYNVDDVHSGRLHAGIDLGVSTGTPVYAAQSGTVVGTDTSSGYGHDVVIDHGGGIFTRFAHNSKLLVSKGDIVTQGQQIAEAGSTGHSTGPHGHFEIMKTTLKDLFSGYQDLNAYFVDNDNFMKSCGSSATIHVANYTSGVTSTQQSYSSLKTLKTLSKSTGTTKSISVSGRNPQSFAYNNGFYYVQWIESGSNGKDGYIYKYDSNMKKKGSSSSVQTVGHGNGIAFSTKDNKLYSVTVSGIRDNKIAKIIDPDSLKIKNSKSLVHGTSAIAYDRITNRFVTSSGAYDGGASSTGYLYVYNSDLSKQVGAKRIAKKRWKTPGDIAAYGGIIYVTISSYGTSGSGNYIDMYNEDNGDYLGSYSAPYSEIEGIDINDNGEIVLLFHSSDFIQFTGIKANIINGSSDSSNTSSGNQCCVTTVSSSSGGNYCPGGIVVTGKYAGTYELDDYIERVVTAENGGAHPEALKALAIAARTYALNKTDNCKNSIENSTSSQVMAEEASDRVKEALSNVKGSIMLYNGKYFSAQYSSFYGSCNGTQCTSTFIKTPSDEKATFTMPYTYLTTAANAGHEYGLSQNGSHYMATVQGKTYDEILKFFYAEGIEITGVSSSSGSCSLGGSGTYKNGKIWDFNQADYSDAYCGGTIADSGCGPTAMAMVVSTFLNEEHNPSELAKVTTDTGYCSTKTHDYFKKAAEKYNLTYQKLGSDSAEEVMTALNRGDSLVIANVTNENKVDGLDNFWTEGGHYIVLAGHDGRDVWVQDPNKGMAGVNRTNTKGDGVYDFDKYIKPAATNGYMIFKKA